ncbi:BAH and coiled-coil domain-containing protein 1 [Trichonephila clavipes]|nr:BAH and coiled-coil domain-containing protein 1 [Trichonephila clavipes]
MHPFHALPLTLEHRQLRLQWCQARLMWNVTDWQKVVFSDESRFVLGTDDNRVWVWRRPGERYNSPHTVLRHTAHTAGVMVWGVIAYDSWSTLIVMRGTLTGQRFVDDFLRPHVGPFLNGLAGAILQQDNAHPHTARVAQDFLRHFQILPWPACSPDLSPVEHVWDQLKRQMPSCHSASGQHKVSNQLNAGLCGGMFVNNSFLKGRQKSLKDISDRSSSNISSTESDNLNSSFSSVDNDEAEEKSEDNQISPNLKAKAEDKLNVIDIKTKRRSRITTVKKEPSNETSSALSDRRITRRNVLRQKPSDKILEISEESKSIKRSSRSKTGKLKKALDSVLNSSSETSQAPSSKSTTISRTSFKKSSSLPENAKTTKVYSLRHTSQNSVTKKSETAEIAVLVSKTISSKRKSVNPKKYIPSKQSKLSETIIAKQLRSRILFDTSGSTSDDENLKDGVPDDLYVALMKCHLGEETKCGGKLLKDIDVSKSSIIKALGYPEPKRLNPEHLVERQRLLALEDGLFYAGFIKEYQSPKKYGIALDGQRGNRLHMFTREELLTQAIVESKPLTSELPEGTRVCAYWSQQYRCLYPGVVGKAPCPSADWSEPRVFVLFDDGDSGQIPAKNVRLIPEDIIPVENISRTDPMNALTSCYNRQRTSSRGRSRKLKCSSPKSSNMKHSDTSNENESKESSCGSINESSCDDSCFIDYSLSPSHTPEDHNSMSCSLNSTSSIKMGKRQRKHSKRRTSRRIKLEQVEPSEKKDKCEAKTKRHKKYKDKHRKHHHHHHHRHHHHHHHHHSKKRKHKRKFAKNTTPQDLENCIPCNSNLKSYKDIQSRAKACTDLIEHSSTVNLPQSEQNRVC